MRCRALPVELVKFKVVTVELPAEKLPVRLRCVPVAEEKVRVPRAERPETESEVEVTLVEVTLAASKPPNLSEAEPSRTPRSVAGRIKPPETLRFKFPPVLVIKPSP